MSESERFSWWHPTSHPLWPGVRPWLIATLIVGSALLSGLVSALFSLLMVGSLYWCVRGTRRGGGFLALSEECRRATAYLEARGWVPGYASHTGWLLPAPHWCLGYEQGGLALGFPMVPRWVYAAQVLESDAELPRLPASHTWTSILWWCWRQGDTALWSLHRVGGSFALHTAYRAAHGLPALDPIYAEGVRARVRKHLGLPL